MRLALPLVLAGVLSCGAIAAAQQAPAPQKALYVSAADVAALIAKVGNEKNTFTSILKLGSYNVSIEHRVAVQGASIHDHEAELFVVVDGSGTIVTGGTLVDAKRSNPENQSGTRIEGGTSQKVSKGDVILVPEGTAHWFSENNLLSVMSLHLPRGAK